LKFSLCLIINLVTGLKTSELQSLMSEENAVTTHLTVSGSGILKMSDGTIIPFSGSFEIKSSENLILTTGLFESKSSSTNQNPEKNPLPEQTVIPEQQATDHVVTDEKTATIKEIETKECTEFIRGRKTQYISDFWPDIPKEKGRSRIIYDLLPSLTATPELLEKNYQHTYSSRFPGVFTPCEKDLSVLSPTEQFHMGRHWQSLLDGDRRKWTPESLNKLTLVQIANIAIEFRGRLSTGFFRMVKGMKNPTIRARNQAILQNVDIIECRGNKCRISFFHGGNAHCVSCFGNLNPEDVARNPYPEFLYPEGETINCHGRRCGFVNHGYYFCESCCGFADD
jgi:hypothetical protein